MATMGSLLAASSASGVIHHETGSISISVSGNQGAFAGWNIDNPGGSGDYNVTMTATASSNTNFGTYNGSLTIQANTANMSFARIAGNVSQLAPVSANGIVSASNANYAFAGGTVSIFNSDGSTSQYGLNNIPQNTATIIGFRFEGDDSKIHYGVASITWNAFGSNGVSFEINEWWWNGVENQGITGSGQAVPEPAEVALGLGALALGAAGLRRWRKRKAA